VAEHEPSIGQSDDWHTPKEIFDGLKGADGARPCASRSIPARPLTGRTTSCRQKSFTPKEHDGLHQPWFGLVFMNPPFGCRRGHVPWLLKFFAHGNGIAICRAYTSSDWWHEVVVPNAQTLCFPNGKTKFIRPNGEIGTAPGHGVALVGMGKICNDALRKSGLGWFVELRADQRRPNEESNSYDQH
jgi:hypothetical protein